MNTKELNSLVHEINDKYLQLDLGGLTIVPSLLCYKPFKHEIVKIEDVFGFWHNELTPFHLHLDLEKLKRLPLNLTKHIILHELIHLYCFRNYFPYYTDGDIEFKKTCKLYGAILGINIKTERVRIYKDGDPYYYINFKDVMDL